MRLKFISVALGIAFLVLALGLFNLEILQGARLKALSEKNCIRLLEQSGTRGKILDCNGKIIVDSHLAYDLLLSAEDKKSAEITLDGLAQFIGISPLDLKKRFRKNFSGSSVPVLIASNIGLNKAIALEEKKMDLSGIIIHPRPLRHYPHGTLACHLLGYLGEIDHWRLTRLADYGYKTKDIVGYSGVEERYDYYLRQESGGLAIQVDHRGKFIRTMGFKPPVNGSDIQLTLDLRLQKICTEAFRQRKGSIIIIDPYTGEIRALVSGPEFAPALFVEKPGSSGVAEIFTQAGHPLLNRALNGLYPAASVFKLVVAAAALEEGRINLAKFFVCGGAMHIGKREFACWQSHGPENLIEAIAHSCDVFFYHTGMLLGPQALHDYALKFGLGKATGIDLPYESAGLVPDPFWKKLYRFQNWYDGDTANLAIGQGELLVTPLQVARMTASFANQGMLVTPFIVKAIKGKDVSLAKRKMSKLPFKKKTWELIRQGLRQVVFDATGTASHLSDLTIAVAGKTGTAQVSRGAPHGWFTGFFPFEKPALVICVFLEHGGSGTAAVQVAKEIILEMLKQGLV
jgi:penicillin-binding protein 2